MPGERCRPPSPFHPPSAWTLKQCRVKEMENTGLNRSAQGQPQPPSPPPWPHLSGSGMVKAGWRSMFRGGVLGTQLSECGPRCSQEITPQDKSAAFAHMTSVWCCFCFFPWFFLLQPGIHRQYASLLLLQVSILRLPNPACSERVKTIGTCRSNLQKSSIPDSFWWEDHHLEQLCAAFHTRIPNLDQLFLCSLLKKP